MIINVGFVFKQKTAYEMRISDWSSDVCSSDLFPPETRDYVPMVIAAAWLFLHPKQYGLTFPDVHVQPAQLQLRKPASIYELAICQIGKHTSELQSLMRISYAVFCLKKKKN